MFLKVRHRFRNTLALRLTLWYAGIFIISSCVAFLLFYLFITSVIREQTDEDLLKQAGKFSSLLSLKGVDAVKRVAILEAQAAGEKKIFVRLLHPSGDAFSSSNMSYWKDIDIKRMVIKKLLQDGSHVFETVSISNEKHTVRILYAIIGPGIFLQLGQSMEHYTRFIEAFKKIFFITMSVLIFLSAIIGWFMAKQALSGVAEITRTARSISGGSLKNRVPVKEKNDEIDQLAITFNQMLDRIEKLVTGIKEMSDNIAHDLKSPITRIRGLAEVTLTAGKSMDEYENMAASTIEECDRLLDMVNTMLVISQTEAGVELFKPEKIDIASIVKDACNLFEAVGEEKGLVMSCIITEKAYISGDVRMMQRMIANLLDNAIKYTISPGEINVKVNRDPGGNIVVSVRDTGMGITDRDLPHIFERFYRCDPSREQGRLKPGVGLGLCLARVVARAHGGDIHVKSRSGFGSTFKVFLPQIKNIKEV